ncbi:MAG: hypothetical protein JOZ45_20055, partial [Acidobacteriaceae bacterium]|nr:hypothetical protein [Acidobacteriaceae bacterium]
MKARPLSPHASLEQYKKQAKDLLKACISLDAGAIRALAAQWFNAYAYQEVETQARLQGVAVSQQLRESIQREELDRIEKSIRASKLSKPDPKLADAQFVVARVHGFESWPKFAKQVQVLQRGNSQSARFEAAADAIISGDIQTLERLLHNDPQLVFA